MAWRSYVDPQDGQLYWTDDQGQFIPDAQWRRESSPNITVPPPTPMANPSFPVVGGMAQLAPYMQGMDAVQTARRMNELDLPNAEWQAAMQYMDRSGYQLPGLRNPFDTPTYQTVMGPRTMAEMRRELVQAGGEDWEKKNDAEIIAGYARTARGTGGEQSEVTRTPLWSVPKRYWAPPAARAPEPQPQPEQMGSVPEKPLATGPQPGPVGTPLSTDELARRWIESMNGRY